MPYQEDTIAAIATPVGEGGVSVIRVSGPEALSVVAKRFKGKTDINLAKSHTAHFGFFSGADGAEIDEVVVVVFLGPHSYTGENVVEISCHGGMFVTQKILDAVIDYRARHAEPGEFTKRAFLNGRIDLSQAEAVADLIHARSELSHRASIQQLKGTVSQKVKLLRDQLVQTIGLLELELDFVEEGLEFVDHNSVLNQITSTVEVIDELVSSYTRGRVFREGVKVVLAGVPNVGKSSILNAMLSEDRAIVTDLPGTTRDVIEETIIVGGLAFRLSDTAGLRETDHMVEVEGVRRSEHQVRNCDLMLLVFDGSRPLRDADLSLAKRLISETMRSSAKCLIVLNKIDLGKGLDGDPSRAADFLAPYPFVQISARTGQGLDELKQMLVTAVAEGRLSIGDSSPVVTNSRHYRALRKAREALLLSAGSLKRNEGSELVAVDLRTALDSLGEIIGVVTTEDILNDIFSKFCVGK